MNLKNNLKEQYPNNSKVKIKKGKYKDEEAFTEGTLLQCGSLKKILKVRTKSGEIFNIKATEVEMLEKAENKSISDFATNKTEKKLKVL